MEFHLNILLNLSLYVCSLSGGLCDGSFFSCSSNRRIGEENEHILSVCIIDDYMRAQA